MTVRHLIQTDAIYERVQETGTYLDTVAVSIDQAEPKTVQDFLDRIENQELYHVLIIVGRLKEKVKKIFE